MTQLRPLLACLLVGAAALAQDPPPPAKEKEDPRAAAVKLAEQYVALIKEQKATEALHEHWSFERLCAGIFKGDWEKLSAADKAATARGFHDVLLPTLTDPTIAKAMAGATYEGFEAKAPEKGKVEVCFTVTLPLPDAQPTKQFLWAQKVDGKWLIVDMAHQAAEKRLTRSIGAQWAQTKKEHDGITPLDYVRLMAQGR